MGTIQLLSLSVLKLESPSAAVECELLIRSGNKCIVPFYEDKFLHRFPLLKIKHCGWFFLVDGSLFVQLYLKNWKCDFVGTASDLGVWLCFCLCYSLCSPWPTTGPRHSVVCKSWWRWCPSQGQRLSEQSGLCCRLYCHSSYQWASDKGTTVPV